ncbi:DNA-processing protein DprA [Nonomuraea sp. NPDC048826]|uniref:DNA-processing protein DprA n=1 Tax=Nonomuraea sp. NPDC048826 TaxID=3364347 RepID=UPI00371F8C9F
MRAADAGDTVMGALVSQLGAVRALQAVREQTTPPESATDSDLARRLPSWQARLTACDPAADLEAGEETGARFVIPGDAEWPTQLDALGTGRPLGLWLHGTADLRFSCLRSVAVVGARAATSYGVHVAAQFGIGLSEAGWTVVSGGAFGVDGAAHRGALGAGAPTVAVLACGVDYCYPAEHRSLFARIRDHGVLVSECPPGVRPTRARFLIRNRLIAALSRGTLVVEAALRSGALNTAGHALTLDRHLAAVPGPITSTLSDGCHRLLRERKAVCVTTPEEMIELVGVMGDDLAPVPRAPALPRDSLPEATRRVLDAVPARISAGPATIAVTAGVDFNTALSALGSLAAAGYIERTANGWRARRPPTPIYPKALPTTASASAAAPIPASAAVPVPASAAVPVPASAAVPVPASAAVPVPASAAALASAAGLVSTSATNVGSIAAPVPATAPVSATAPAPTAAPVPATAPCPEQVLPPALARDPEISLSASGDFASGDFASGGSGSGGSGSGDSGSGDAGSEGSGSGDAGSEDSVLTASGSEVLRGEVSGAEVSATAVSASRSPFVASKTAASVFVSELSEPAASVSAAATSEPPVSATEPQVSAP